MTTDSHASFQNIAIAAYDIFMWPGTYLLSRLPQHAPELALMLGLGTDENSIALTAMLSAIVWSLLVFLAWLLLEKIFANMFYGARRFNLFVTGKFEVMKRRRLLSQPVEIPEVEFDELDIAVLNMGSTIPPGLGLTAAELSGPLTKRPAQVQKSLEKLKKYGLVDDAIGMTDGFNNYCLTRSGAAILSMWQRQGLISRPA